VTPWRCEVEDERSQTSTRRSHRCAGRATLTEGGVAGKHSGRCPDSGLHGAEDETCLPIAGSRRLSTTRLTYPVRCRNCFVTREERQAEHHQHQQLHHRVLVPVQKKIAGCVAAVSSFRPHRMHRTLT